MDFLGDRRGLHMAEMTASASAAHNASVQKYGRDAADRPVARHHGGMRDDDSPAIGALVRRAVDGDEQATHDL
ncbi:MAG TPA: hypothetical protein VGL02_06070, partial [Streptomyces sp.]